MNRVMMELYFQILWDNVIVIVIVFGNIVMCEYIVVNLRHFGFM